MTEALRSSNKANEILASLIKLQEEGVPCTIWQNIEDRKVHTQCYIESIDMRLGTIILSPSDGQFSFDFKNRSPIFFRGEKLSLLFKEFLHYSNDKLLVINIPQEIKILEKRQNPRICFAPGEGRSASASKYDSKTLEARNFELELLDLSQGGLAFFLTAQQAGSISKGDSLLFSRILSLNFDEPLMATVLYSTPTRLKLNETQKRGLRVGVSFQEKIENERWKDLSLS